MEGAFAHDALCQLMRMELLPRPRELIIKVHRAAKKIWLSKGMWKWRANLWFNALVELADFAVDPANAKKVYEV
jgi:hypothetical protein